MNRNYNNINRKTTNSKNNGPKITALYCRLSLEDGKENESMSGAMSIPWTQKVELFSPCIT